MILKTIKKNGFIGGNIYESKINTAEGNQKRNVQGCP